MMDVFVSITIARRAVPPKQSEPTTVFAVAGSSMRVLIDEDRTDVAQPPLPRSTAPMPVSMGISSEGITTTSPPYCTTVSAISS